MSTTRRENSTYIFVHTGMLRHPKIRPLAPATKLALLELWLHCGEYLTDGAVDEATWQHCTTPKIRRELLAAGLVEEVQEDAISQKSQRNGVVMHDYLDWQRSAAEAAETTTKKATAGTRGNHQRWHVGQGKRSPACPYCRAEAAPAEPPNPPNRASQVRSQTDRRNLAEVEVEVERVVTRGGRTLVTEREETATSAAPAEPPRTATAVVQPPLMAPVRADAAETNPVWETTPEEAHRRTQAARYRGRQPQGVAERWNSSRKSGRAHRLVERWVATLETPIPKSQEWKFAQAIDDELARNRTAGFTDEQLYDALVALSGTGKGLGPASYAGFLRQVVMGGKPVGQREGVTARAVRITEEAGRAWLAQFEEQAQ